MLKALQGRGAAGSRTSRVAGKAHYQALFIGRVAEGRILHGKEGVEDGSSPSEGSAKDEQMAFFLAGERCGLRCVGHRSVPKTCPHERADSWFLALTDASEAVEHF